MSFLQSPLKLTELAKFSVVSNLLLLNLQNDKDSMYIAKYVAADDVFSSMFRMEIGAFRLYKATKRSLNHLAVSTTMSEELESVVPTVFLRFKTWFERIHDLSEVPFPIFRNAVKFTGQASVDELETIATIVRDESVERRVRYQLACQYCLEEVILALSSPVNLKDAEISKYYNNFMRSFWTYRVQGANHTFWRMYRIIRAHGLGQDLKFMSFTDDQTSNSQFGCVEAVFTGPLVAVKFFRSQLCSEEKVVVFKELDNLIPNLLDEFVHPRENIAFVVRELYQIGKTEILTENPNWALDCFVYEPIDWFKTLANLLWDFMDCPNFFETIRFILSEELFVWFLSSAPEELKNKLQDCEEEVYTCYHDRLGSIFSMAIDFKWLHAVQFCLEVLKGPIARKRIAYKLVHSQDEIVSWVLSNFFFYQADLVEIQHDVKNIKISDCKYNFQPQRLELIIDNRLSEFKQ